jgi:predicted transposase/invertase (TIGR01784 family)
MGKTKKTLNNTEKTAIYINPFTDFGFKRLFGTEENKDLLIDFLNQLLPTHHQIIDLTFRNIEQMPLTEQERKAFFDIYCTIQGGSHIVIEMQKAKMEYFKDRTLLYSTYPIQSQAPKSKDWNFKLESVYFIGILDFPYEPDEGSKFIRNVFLKDQDNEIFYEKLNIIFLQMPAFKKKIHELETNLDKWAFFLKNLESFDELPSILQIPILVQASESAKLAKMTMEQRQLYEKSRLEYNAMKAIVDTAKKDGINEGINKGIQKSDKKWKPIVIEAQRKQEEERNARMEAQRNSIKMALEFGATPETIAEKLNLPLDEVNRIIKTL